METVFWLTDFCNLQCTYCYEREKTSAKKLTYNKIEMAMRLIEQYVIESHPSTLHIGFHGGEPMLEYDLIKEIIELCNRSPIIKKIKVTFVMTTNATLLTSESSEFIANQIDSLSISIDGKKESHDKHRVDKYGNGTFDIVSNNLSKILNIAPFTRLRPTITRSNINNIYENIIYLIGIGGRLIAPTLDTMDTSWSDEDQITIISQLIKVYDYLEINELTEFLSVSMMPTKDNPITPVNRCSFGKNKFVIHPDGFLYPCILMAGKEDFQIGTIENGINNSRVAEFLSHNADTVPQCTGCNFYSYCSGPRCKIINKQECGNYCTPPAITCFQSNIISAVNEYTSQ